MTRIREEEEDCTLQYGPDLVLLGISDLVRFIPIWSDLVIRVTRDRIVFTMQPSHLCN